MISRRIETGYMWVLFLCSTVLADDTFPGEIETESENRRPLVQIFLEPIQGKIGGPNQVGKNEFSDMESIRSVLSWLELPTALAEAPAGNATGFSHGGRNLTGVSSNNYWFDYYHAFKNGILGLDKSAQWELFQIDGSKQSGLMRKIAARLFEEKSIEHVVFLDSTYFVSPGLNQVRLIVDADVYSRPVDTTSKQDIEASTTRAYERSYEYLSQSRGTILRPFGDGEKEALIESIEDVFDQKVKRYPNNRAAYKKDLDRALKALNYRDVVLPHVAVSEGWPGRSFPIALQLATDSIMQMMQDDLIDLSASKTKNVEFLPFGGLDRKGKPRKFKGYAVGQQGLNTIFRDKRGNMYSVPYVGDS